MQCYKTDLHLSKFNPRDTWLLRSAHHKEDYPNQHNTGNHFLTFSCALRQEDQQSSHVKTGQNTSKLRVLICRVSQGKFPPNSLSLSFLYEYLALYELLYGSIYIYVCVCAYISSIIYNIFIYNTHNIYIIFILYHLGGRGVMGLIFNRFSFKIVKLFQERSSF